MGFELRRWLADHLPAELSSGERLVALEIADQANERTRRAYGPKVLETVIRRTGFADDKQLGKVLGKLGSRGVELRVPVRGKDGRVVTDQRGRVVFACNGHAREFYVPTSDECPALKVPRTGDLDAPPSGRASTEGLPFGGASDAEAPPPGPEAPPPGPEAPPSGGPISSVSSASPHLSPREADASTEERETNQDPLTRRLMAQHGATAEEATAILSDARREGLINSLTAWADSGKGRTDIAERLARFREQSRQAATAPSLPAWCGRCDADTRLIEIGDQVARCTQCNPRHPNLRIGAAS